MKINKKIAFSETGFVFDASTGDSYSMNSIGLEIIGYIKQNLSKEEIRNKLSEKYDVNSSVLEKAVDEFVDSLENFNIIEND